MSRIYDDDTPFGLGTRAVHAGQRPDPTTGAIMTPVYQTSTYAQEGIGRNRGYEYARGKNPTREALERNVASLEGGKHGFAFGSGMAALDSIMKLFKSGDHFVCADNMYGGTPRLFERILTNFGLTFSYVDCRDPQRIADAVTSSTRAVIIETPTNPLMRLVDLGAAAEIAQRAGAYLVVDNTFATPVFQRPIEHGADIVFHSSTKYLNGHSDMVGGVVILRTDELADRMQFILNAAGAVPGPMDAWLVLRGTKTLHLRMAAHDHNGRKVATWLSGRLGSEHVFYPGLKSHPQHELACRQMSGFGGMVSVDVGTRDNAEKVVTRLRVFTLAESLGGVESLVCHPATMTHASVPAERRAAIGIGDGLVRFSVGVEDSEDLLADLETAFQGI
ncbi:MAG TPA: PLP-dependent aspartate aminotransferase family protein [Gemmatimonadaceae bacterium]